MVMDISKRDRRLFYALTQDCRQGARELARLSGYNEGFVREKIKRFEAEGLITGYQVRLDPAAFGLRECSLDITFENLSAPEFDMAVAFIEEREQVRMLDALDRDFALRARLALSDEVDFEPVLRDLKERFGPKIASIALLRIGMREEYLPAYLLGKAADDSGIVLRLSKAKKLSLDALDRNLLALLAHDCKMPILELSRRLHQPARTVDYRMKRLEKERVILAYRAIINTSLIGYRPFLVRLESYADREQVVSFARANPFVVGFEEIGPFVYLLRLESESIEGVSHLLKAMRERFAPVKRYRAEYIVETRKDLPPMP